MIAYFCIWRKSFSKMVLRSLYMYIVMLSDDISLHQFMYILFVYIFH